MTKTYSTCIFPENSEMLLFSMRSETYLYHCWLNNSKKLFVVIKESNDLSVVVPNQILNFTKKSLQKYLATTTSKLKEIDELLFFNDVLWNKYLE